MLSVWLLTRQVVAVISTKRLRHQLCHMWDRSQAPMTTLSLDHGQT